MRRGRITRPSLQRSWTNGQSFSIAGMAQAILATLPAKSNHANQRVVVLCYHSVHPSHEYASATPELFDQHLRWLREHCDIIPFAQALDRRDDRTGAKPSVAITFDDGFMDNHTHALPILLGAGAHATFFVTTGLIDRDREVIARLQRLWGLPADGIAGLSWGQVAELRDEGMDIGAHTVSHPNLADLSDEVASSELSGAKDVLEDHLGEQIVSLAYPFGVPRRNFSQRTMEIARGIGYERAAAILYRNVRPSDDALAIPRLAVTGDSVGMLEAKVQGKLDSFGLWQEHAPQWLTSIMSHSNKARRIS